MNRYPLWVVAGMIVLSTAAVRASLHGLGGEAICAHLLATPLSLPAGTLRAEPQDEAYAGTCKPWVQVNDDGFNEHPGTPYTGQDAFELTVFNGQIYLGMEGKEYYGPGDNDFWELARVWRTKAGVVIASSQADWEQVVDDGFDGPITDNDHIDSLEPFNGYLYASTAMKDGTKRGTQVWRSATSNKGTWIQVNRPGFGVHTNENFKDMVAFQGLLCAGTANLGSAAEGIPPGAQVWCTDGVTADLTDPTKLLWTQQNVNGFGDPNNVKVWSSGIFNGYLYLGLEGYDVSAGAQAEGTVWRTNDISDPNSWTKLFSATEAGFGAEVNRMDIIGAFGGYLYVGFDRPGDGTQVYRSADGDAYTPVVTDGFGDANNGRVIVDAGTVYNGALYLATLNQVTGAEVWRTADGTTWTQVNTDGFGDANTFAAELIPFNGYLYAWATNYSVGQKVLRTKCPMVRPVGGYGEFLSALELLRPWIILIVGGVISVVIATVWKGN